MTAFDVAIGYAAEHEFSGARERWHIVSELGRWASDSSDTYHARVAALALRLIALQA